MYLGSEIGGTKLQLAVGDGTGDGGGGAGFRVLERRDVDPSRGAAGILAQIQECAATLLERFEVQRIGIGFGGPVDSTTGRVITSHQIDGWNDVRLVDWVRETLNVPAVIGNDCDCAALAEARFGAGKGHRTVFYVTVGTGVGGGLVIGGRVHGTDRPSAAEIGHLRPGLLATGSNATVESLASGWGIAATARACLTSAAPRFHDDLLPSGRPPLNDADRRDLLDQCGGHPEALTTRMIAQAAAGGKSGARTILRTGTDVLGWAIAQVMALVAPDVVIVGGGVSLTGEDLFMNPLREAVARYVFPPLANECRLVAPCLGEEVVVHGAIALAMP